MRNASANGIRWTKPMPYIRVLSFGLAIPDGSRLPDYLAEPYVHEVFSLARAAGNEAHHLLGFLRFEELKNGVFNCHGAPKAQYPASVSRPFQ